jgi:hypothetical protein
MFDIIKNAELPQVRRAAQYPFDALNVGDGFDAPDDLDLTSKGFSRRIVSIKNGVAKYRKDGAESHKYLTGPHPTDARLVRCVRVR